MWRLISGPSELAVFRRQKLGLLLTIGLFSCFVNLLMLSGPLYMLQVYDRVLASGSMESLVALTALVIFLYGMMGLLDFARGRIGARFGALLQVGLEERAFQVSLKRADRTGAVQPALSDLTSIQRFAASPVFMSVFDVPWTPIFIAAIFLFQPALGWLAIAGVVTMVSITLLNQAVSARSLAMAGAAGQGADRLANELHGEAELIQSLGMVGSGFARWQRARSAALREAMRASDVVGGFTALTRMLRFVLQSAVLGLGAMLVLQGQMSAGAMIAGSILLGRALAPIELAVGQWQMIAEAALGWRRLDAALLADPPLSPGMALPRPAARLEISHLAVSAPDNKRPLLRGVTFTLAPGRAVGVIGPSGAGKSTLARAVTGVWRPSAGHIRLDGSELDQYGADALGRLIGYLPQSVRLFDGTIAENIARLDLDFESERVISAARRAAAHDLIQRMPQGYDTRLSCISTQLSGGQIQRIGLARALYTDPVLLVLDEPNSALDNDGSDALNRVIHELKENGCGVLIMAHRPSAIRECDDLLVLQDGVPTAFGPTREVLKKTLSNYADLRRRSAR